MAKTTVTSCNFNFFVDQGDEWHEANAYLRNEPMTISIRATVTGDGDLGNIAIDDVTIQSCTQYVNDPEANSIQIGEIFQGHVTWEVNPMSLESNAVLSTQNYS